MGSEVVVTYKRKRLFSRNDHCYKNLLSEVSKSKPSEDTHKHVEPIEEYMLQNKVPEVGICNQYSGDKVEENVRQCGNCDSHSEKMHGIERQDSAEDRTQKFTPDVTRLSPKSVVEETIPNVLLEGSSGDRFQADSAGPSNDEEKSADTQSKFSSMKRGSDCVDKCKEVLSVVPHQLCLEPSISGSVTSEEANKHDKDKANNLGDNLVTKRKLPPTLITFCRRSKRSKIVAPDASCSVDLKEENVKAKFPSLDNEENRPTKDTEKSCSFSAPAPAAAMVRQTDNPQNTAKEESCAETPLQEKVCKDVHQENRSADVGPDSLTTNDVTSKTMLSGVLENRDSQLSLGLSVSPRGFLDIDCNRPLDFDSDENPPFEPPKVPPGSVCSTSKLKEPTLQVLQDSHTKAASRDKGKSIMDPQPVLTGSSSKNHCMQLFPEKPEKVDSFRPSSLHPPNFHGLSLQPEQMVDYRAFYTPSYQWPYIQPQPRESFHDFPQPKPDRPQSFSRQKMMLDNILTRARAVRGNRSSFLDKFDYPTTWSEEELDSLWIGVRRHGRGNWDAILADRRLHFPRWKTARDLADRWKLEQAQLFCSKPISQLQNGLGANTVLGGPSSSYSHLMNRWPGPLPPSLGEESSSSAGPMMGGLPHWLRAAVEVPPPRPFDPIPTVGSSVGVGLLGPPGFECRQPWLYPGQSTEPHNAAGRRGKMQVNERAVEKEDELIIIQSDASSEETISDDRNGRSL